MNTIKDNLLEPDQLAAELDTTRRTLDRWHARRIGPPRITVGRKIYYRREAVQDWLLQNEQQGAA